MGLALRFSSGQERMPRVPRHQLKGGCIDNPSYELRGSIPYLTSILICKGGWGAPNPA